MFNTYIKRIYLLVILLMAFLSLLPQSIVAADNRGFEGLIPTEAEMGYPCSGSGSHEESDCNEFSGYEYKKHPIGHYSWDTVHEWVRMRLVFPEIGNVQELMITTVSGMWMGINIILTRFAIFFLQFAFAKSDLFTEPLSRIDELLQPVKFYVYDNLFFLAALVLAAIVIIKYGQGRKGDAFGAVLKAVIVSSALWGVVQYSSFILINLLGIVDYITLTVLGLVNLSPLQAGSAAWVAQSKIIEISNAIFSIYIDQPWTFGQFNSLETPMVTGDEVKELTQNEIGYDIRSGDDWKTVMLEHAANSDDRKAMVEVMTDDEIDHDSTLDTYMLERGGLTRLGIAFTSTLTALTGIILYGAIAFLQIASNMGLLILMVFLGSMIIFSFFGDFGMRMIMKYGGFMIWMVGLKVAAAFFIGIPMLIFQILTVTGMPFLVISSVHLFVNLLALIFLPKIWTSITPAIMRGVAQVTNQIGSAGGRRFRGSYGEYPQRTPPPIPSERQRSRFHMANRYRNRTAEEVEAHQRMQKQATEQSLMNKGTVNTSAASASSTHQQPRQAQETHLQTALEKMRQQLTKLSDQDERKVRLLQQIKETEQELKRIQLRPHAVGRWRSERRDLETGRLRVVAFTQNTNLANAVSGHRKIRLDGIKRGHRQGPST